VLNEGHRIKKRARRAVREEKKLKGAAIAQEEYYELKQEGRGR